MKKPEVDNCYVSSNCNQTPTVADCSFSELIAYGSCHAVFIYDPNYGSGGKVTHTLIGHTKRVNSVRWLRGRAPNYQELVSGASDGSLIVWTLKNNQYVPKFISGNLTNVNIVDGVYKNKVQHICSASMERTPVKVWKRVNEEFILLQELSFGQYSLCVGLHLTLFPNDELVLACALDDSKIQVFTENSENKFVLSTVIIGHEDWVRGLEFTHEENGDILLASASQDSFIRLWRITSNEILDTSKTITEDTNRLQIKTQSKIYNVFLESVLAGHEGWVYSVNWSLTGLQLLSTSIDKTMIIWEHDAVSGLWLEKVRVGEVGGNTLGFYGGFFTPNSQKIIAHSYHGAFHIWTKTENLEWQPSVTVGGHFSEVVDLAWEPQGEFLYSAGADQTTRIHAPWSRDNKEETWHEIARPQVHGYDMSSLAVLSRYKFASGAEEKVVRTFEAPNIFIQNFKRICQVESEQDCTEQLSTIPKGASVPSLGLSNKAVYTDDNLEDTVPIDKKNPYPEESHFTVQILTEPPTEETLLQNTLWPEVQKLYGHGYEVFSLAGSPDGKYLASACKSTKIEHAAIFIWDTSSWTQIQKLLSHNLTVVQMQFSPDSQHLLSVSRDRRWSLFSKNEKNTFDLVATTDKNTSVHTRIIWTCAWTHDSKYFATGSREGKLAIWTRNEKLEPLPPLGIYENVSKLEFENESVTATAFAPDFLNGSYFCAIGLEKGIIYLYQLRNLEFLKLTCLLASEAHHLTVKKLTFRPKFGKAGHKSSEDSREILQLASCSSDSSVRIYNINFS